MFENGLYLSGDKDKSIPRNVAISEEYLQVVQCTISIRIVEFILKTDGKEMQSFLLVPETLHEGEASQISVFYSIEMAQNDQSTQNFQSFSACQSMLINTDIHM